MRARIAVVCFFVTSMLACATPTETARFRFSRDDVCPSDRVSVRDGPTLLPDEIILQAYPPPDDVKKDPERLEMWMERYGHRLRAQHDLHVYDASGCGAHSRIACGTLTVGITVCTTISHGTDADDRLAAETARVLRDYDDLLHQVCHTRGIVEGRGCSDETRVNAGR